MSFSPRYLPRASTSTSHPLKPLSRRLATPSAFSPHPPLRASLLLSRPALLLRTPDALVSAYHAHSISLRHALSNPTPTDFYFRPDSLPLRRFLISQHSFDTSTYGPDLAGPLPDVGDLLAELGVDEVPRDKWEKEDGGRGEKGLERMAEEEVFCLVRRKDGRWEFPGVEVVAGEGLHEAVERGLVGVDGGLGGRGMDTWLVARKPMGMVRDGDARTFFLRSHVLAGEPELAPAAPWSGWAWLTAGEVEGRLVEQGDERVWEGVRGMFGVGVEEQEAEEGD